MAEFRRLAELLLLLAVAAPAAAGAPAGESRAEFARRLRSEVRDFGFEEELVLAPHQAPIPGEWERCLEYTRPSPAGQGLEVLSARPAGDEPVDYGRFPDFLRVEVVELGRAGVAPGAVHGGRRAVRMELSGTRDMQMVGIRRREPLEIDPAMAYELAGWVRFEGASRPDTWAQLWAEWLDARGQRVGPVSESERVGPGRDSGWLRLRLPVGDVDGRARAVRVWCVASGREVGGLASFDDISVRSRTKIAIRPAGPAGRWILAPGEPAAFRVRYSGLDPSAGGRRVSGYRRTLRWAELYGRTGPADSRTFPAGEVRDAGLEEQLLPEGLDAPGAYALELRLEELGADGAERVLAERAVRVVRLAPAEAAGAEGWLCAADLDLYGPEAADLAESARLCGIRALAFPLWRAESDPARLRSAGEAAGPEAGLDQRLRAMLAWRPRLTGELAPLPTWLQRAGHRPDRARSLYLNPPETGWGELVDATEERFRAYVSEWRMAPAGDDSLVPAADRLALASALQRRLGGAAGRRLVVPVPLAGLGADAAGAPAAPEWYRELVHVPAAVSPAELEAALEPLGPAGARGRRWYLELLPAGAAADLNMESERRQAADLARKLALLVSRGAEQVSVELADRAAPDGAPVPGLIGPGLTPRPACAAYAVLAAHLGGASFIGELSLAEGARALAFEREGRGLAVFWTDGPDRQAPAQLGRPGQARLVELTGARRELRPAPGRESPLLAGAELLPLSRLPALLVGLDPLLLRTRLDFRLVPGSRLETRYAPQEIVFEFRNHFAEPVRALVHPRFPPGAQVAPRFRDVAVEPGRTALVSFAVRPSIVETTGRREVGVELALTGRAVPATAFTLRQALPVESPLALEPAVAPADDGRSAEVQVSVRLSAEPRYLRAAGGAGPGLDPEEDRDAEVSLTLPGGVRHTMLVRGLRPGRAVRLEVPFSAALGPAPQRAYVGARLRGGEWFANVELELPAAGLARP